MKALYLSSSLVVLSLSLACNNDQKATETTAAKEDSIAVEAKETIGAPKPFEKTLSLQHISFKVIAEGKGSLQQMTIIPSGLSISNDTIKAEVDGKVLDAVIADLNTDGSPELLVFTVSAGSGSYGNVLGYSVNNGKSVSMIYFPSVAEDKILGKGYMGHDTFSIVENKLIHQFPVYNESDANASPTGGMRRIGYKLVNGEASRKFVADQIISQKPKP